MASYLKYYLGIFLLILLLPLDLEGQTTVLLDNTSELKDIGLQTQYLEDASLNLTIDDIISDKMMSNFQTNTKETINFSSTASAYWLKFDIKKEVSDNFYLNVGSAFIDVISLYEYDSSGQLISTRHTGDDLPFDTREVEIGNYLFELDFDPGTTRTFYLRVKCDQPLFFLLRVGTLSNFVAYTHDLDFVQGIYFGFMLLIFLYNLFLYISIRERIYLYYIAYVVIVTWFGASVFGYFFEYFWSDYPIINKFVVISAGLTMITATLFTQQFLNTKESGSRLHKISMIFLIVGFLVCALVIVGFKIEGLKLSQVGLLAMAAYFLVLGIRFKLKGFRPAIYYLLAWGALIVGICFTIFESLDMIPVMKYLNPMQIGSAFEVLLLSFALGDRINMYKKQKEDAQLEALISAKENEKLIQEQNIILERKVEERTAVVALRNKELVDLNKEKDMLVSMVAHDLRTPLHQMKGSIWLLDIPNMKLTGDQETYLNAINSSVDRLTDMIGRILDTQALETKKIKLVNETLDIVELVEYVAKCFDLIAKEKNIEIGVEAEMGMHLVEIDKNYMIQVLENLLSNAIKFSNTESKVVLRVHSDTHKTRVIVEDNGPGISEDDQKKLFGKFQKLTAQPTAGESSTGLGLSIVKKYVEAMKGTIHCESTLGEGTQFIITLDAKDKLQKVDG
ncbi:sensor histidine kinase [Aquimarina litoralis]|uniref:sensor histidine kinase n=1 Tax=Aquimarina litoralis TaxID=584605 RepID=UPI001C58401C|nr:sensor histidine kinase [Aquimarina litoralis]MBW1296450.1 hypothetical protein [Aquimarina litoralis]